MKSFSKTIKRDPLQIFHNSCDFLLDRFVLYVNDSSHVSDVAANDGMWHHIAVTWASRNGRWVIYKDGRVADSGEGLAEGAVIPGKARFMLNANARQILTSQGCFRRDCFAGVEHKSTDANYLL